MKVEMKYKKRDKASLLDWNYETDGQCRFVFDLPHKTINHNAFSNKWMQLVLTYDESHNETITLLIADKYTWDGCSCVPDLKGTLEGSLPHDVIYQFVEELAKALAMSLKDVLSFGDTLFNLTMEYAKTNKVVRTVYYKAVCTVGYYFNRFNAFRNKLFK